MNTHPSQQSLGTPNVALIYVRVSRLDEEERGRKLSPDTQREKALALAELGGLTVEVFEDLDISGKDTANRPGYLRLMERLERVDVRYVVGYDLSRMMRNLGDQQDFFKALNRCGATFLDSSRGRVIDVTDEGQELVANIEGAVNQHARKQTGRRVRDTLATKVARGELVGPVPAGYVRRKEVLPSGRIARTWVEPDLETSPTVQMIFTEYATGTHSLKTLAQELNRRGVRPPRRADFNNGRPAAELFTADVLKDLLRNPRYVGRVPRRDGAVFEAAFAPLIDSDTWAACERIRLRQRSDALRTRGRANTRSTYLLSGVLRCAMCGSTMSGLTRHKDRTHPETRFRYACYQRRVGSSCDAPHVPQEIVEAEILDVLRTVALPEGLADAVDAAVAAYFTDRGRATRKSTLRSVETRLARLRDLYELGHLTRDDYLARHGELEAERKTLAISKPRPLFLRQQDMLRTLVDDWAHLNIEDRRRLIGEVFAEVRVDAQGVRDFMPRDEWKPYMAAVVPATARVTAERKTGLEPATLTLAR